MMRCSTQWIAGLASIALIALPALPAYGQPRGLPAPAASLVARAQQTIDTFKQKDPAVDSFFAKSAGYAVFPDITEGAFIVGGAHGVLYEHGKPVGETSLSQASIGAQIGGQSYSEVIFFQNPQVLTQFKQGNYTKASCRECARRPAGNVQPSCPAWDEKAAQRALCPGPLQ